MLMFLANLPLIGRIFTWLGDIGIKLYSAKLQALGSHEAKIVELAARELHLDEVEARLNASAKSEIRHIWWAPENLFGFIAISYYAKVITLDFVVGSIMENVFGIASPFTTGFLKGDTALAMTLIMTFWLGKRGVENVASIIGAAFGKRS